MNKRLIIFGVLLAALLLSAVSPWPAVLSVWNHTGENIYITLKYRGEQKYFLTATPQGNAYNKEFGTRYRVSVFDITRRKYSASVYACGTTADGTMDLRTNLRLVFTDCTSMVQWWRPRYLNIERGQEKPNFFFSTSFEFFYNPNNIDPVNWTKVISPKKVGWGLVYRVRPANLYQKLKWDAPFQFVY